MSAAGRLVRTRIVRAMVAVVIVAEAGTAHDAAELQKVEVADYVATREATFDIGALIQSGAVHPRDAITINESRDGCWLLRTPEGNPDVGWPRHLLNAGTASPDLVIDVQLAGLYDVYAIMRQSAWAARRTRTPSLRTA